LREHEPAFRNKGARLAAVGLGDPHYAQTFREETRIEFPLLIDEHREAYRAIELKKATLLHLFRKDNMAARKRAKSGGHSQRRLGKDPMQLGGSFIFGPGGKEYFIHISETFGDNAQPATLLAALS